MVKPLIRFYNIFPYDLLRKNIKNFQLSQVVVDFPVSTLSPLFQSPKTTAILRKWLQEV